MRTPPPNQPRGFGRAVAKFSKGVVDGVKRFIDWTSNPFEMCCGPKSGARGTDNSNHYDEEVLSSPDSSVGSNWTRSRSSSGTSTGTDTSTDTSTDTGTSTSTNTSTRIGGNKSATNVGGSTGGPSLSGCACLDDGGGILFTPHSLQLRVVTYSHDIDVIRDWREYLASTEIQVPSTGRDRSMTMDNEGDDRRSLLEATKRRVNGKIMVQILRRSTRAAHPVRNFDKTENQGGGGRTASSLESNDRSLESLKTLAFPHEKRRNRGCHAAKRQFDKVGFQSYNGSAASLSTLTLPRTNLKRRPVMKVLSATEPGSNDGSYASLRALHLSSTKGERRPAGHVLLDATALAFRSPIQWITATDLHKILDSDTHTKGRKNISNSRGSHSLQRKGGGLYSLSCTTNKESIKPPRARDEKGCVQMGESILEEDIICLDLNDHRSSIPFKRSRVIHL